MGWFSRTPIISIQPDDFVSPPKTVSLKNRNNGEGRLLDGGRPADGGGHQKTPQSVLENRS